MFRHGRVVSFSRTCCLIIISCFVHCYCKSKISRGDRRYYYITVLYYWVTMGNQVCVDLIQHFERKKETTEERITGVERL